MSGEREREWERECIATATYELAVAARIPTAERLDSLFGLWVYPNQALKVLQ